jgi:hypothetical protein
LRNPRQGIGKRFETRGKIAIVVGYQYVHWVAILADLVLRPRALFG